MARLNTVKSFRGTTKTPDGNLTCGKCGDTITRGDTYRWWANKLPGSRGSFRNIRCAKPECTPRGSEMAPGRTGQIMAIGENLDDSLASAGVDLNDAGDFESIRDDLASAIREIGEELEESAQNIEDGFGHETYQSGELRERAERITSAADEIEQLEFPEQDEHTEQCTECGGEGEDEDGEECEACEGKGDVPDLDTWRDACVDAIQDAWGNAEGEMYG